MMDFTYDLDKLTVSFRIGDFPSDVANALQSTLDINGFLSNEPKFREIAAANLDQLGVGNPKVLKKLQTIIKGGKILNTERDREMNQFGLNFALNKYEFSLDAVPGQPDIQKAGTKVLAIIGISREDTSYITAYEDGDTFIYAGKMPVDACPHRPIELMKSAKLVEQVGDITWVTPTRIRVKHRDLQYSMQDAFSFADKMTKVGNRLSAIVANPTFVELTDEPASISQIVAFPIQDEAKMPSLKEIQHIVKDDAWQTLREDLSWTKNNIGSSMRRLRQYLGENPSRVKKVRVLNLLNGVARGGIMTDDILRMQKRLRKQIGVGVKEAAKVMRQCAWCNKDLDTGKIVPYNDKATHGICTECGKKEQSKFDKKHKKTALNYEETLTTVSYDWKDSPMKTRFDWLVPAIVNQTRVKDDKADPGPLTGGDLVILRNLVKKGKRSELELQREKNYYIEWHQGKWSEQDKAAIRKEVFERSIAYWQATYGEKTPLPPFLQELITVPFKIEDRVRVVQGPSQGYEGTVMSVNPEAKSVVLQWPNGLQSNPLPYKHVQKLPKEKTKSTEPEEPKRQWVPVKEELDKVVSKYQPGNWTAFMSGVSSNGTNAEKLKWIYRNKFQMQKDLKPAERVPPTLQQIMTQLGIDNTAASHLFNKVLADAQQCATAEGATKFMPPKKSTLGSSELTAGFMPSLPSQPFWGQHGDGDHGDYPYPMNTLYPKISPEDEDGGGQDTSEAYTHVWDKINPKRLLNLLKKMPVSKDDEADSQEIHKEAGMAVDLFVEQRFDAVGNPTIRISEPEAIAGVYKAKKVKSTPTTLKIFEDKIPKLPYLKEDPIEKMKKEKKVVGPLPEEGEKAPLQIIPFVTHRPFEGVHEFKPSAEILYEVIYVEGDKATPGTIIGYFDASESLAHVTKTDNASKDLSGWLTKKIKDRAGFIRKLFERTRPGSDPAASLTWETAVLQDAISDDWDKALKDIASAPAPKTDPEKQQLKTYNNAVIVFLLDKLLRQNRYKELLAAIAKYKILPTGWTMDTYKELSGQAAILSGVGLGKKPSGAETESEYKNKTDLILYGDDKFPNGGSVEAKENVLRDADPDRIKSFILAKDKDGSSIFAKQPFGVQAVAVDRLDHKKDIRGLFGVWLNKELPSSLRMLALQSLATTHGVHSKYSPEGKFKTLIQDPEDKAKGMKGILTEAAEDPDPYIRALAYTLMVDPDIDVMPWTNKGKLAYEKNKTTTREKQPTNDIPPWLVTQISNEPYPELQGIVYKILEHLPKGLVKEDAPPVLDKDLKITTAGQYSFGEEIRPNIKLLLMAALNSKDPHTRARVRNHFGLPKETELLPKEKEQGTKEFKLVQPSAKDYLFHARDALASNNYEDAEKQLALATHARDAKDHKDEIDRVKARIVELKQKGKEGIEAGERVSKLQEALMDKHPDLREINVLAAFLDWAAKISNNSKFTGLHVKTQERLMSDLVSDDKHYKDWIASLPGEKPEVKEVDRREKKDRRKDDRRERDEINDEPFEKKGSPLSSIELESRQPPTTWPLENPQVGYGPAFPTGSQENRGSDELMLKDVRMFYGRPEGKWRSILNQVYKMIFEDENIKKEKLLGPTKQMLHKEAAPRIPPKNKEEAMEYLKGTTAEANQAIDYFGQTNDEEGLLAAVNAFKSPQEVGSRQALQKILQAAETNNLPRVAEAVFAIPSEDPIHESAVKALVAMKDVPSLNKILYTNWHPWAVRGLIDLGYADQLKDVYRTTKRPLLQRTIVLELGEKGDPEFMGEVLDNPNEDVKLQAVEWLTHHKRFDILKEHSKSEKDPKAKAAIDKALALSNEGPVAEVLEKLDPEEQARKIDQLADTARRAFTKWERYPAMRQEVLGKSSERYPISSFGAGPTSWLAVQPKIDAEVRELLHAEPSFAEGEAAVRELEAIAKKLPDITKRTKTLEAWIEEAKERYKENKTRGTDEKSLSDFKEKIDKAEKNLETAKFAVKGDLEFRVQQLQLLEREAKYRDELTHAIERDDKFKKEYNGFPSSLKEYQAYLKTFDPEYKIGKPQGGAEGIPTIIDKIEKKQEDITWKHTEPIRQQFKQESNAAAAASRALIPFYQRLDISIDKEGNSTIPGIKELNKKIQDLKKLENQWFKLSGAVLPWIQLEGEEERIYEPEGIWVEPDEKNVLPEYARGMTLVKPHVGRLRSPWTEEIAEARKEKDRIRNEFTKSLNKRLPPEGRDLLLEKIEHTQKAAALSVVLQNFNITPREGKLTYVNPTLQERRNKEEYKERERHLLKRMKSMTELKENPSLSPEYIRLKKDLYDFNQTYGFSPIPDTSEANLKRQYQQDRWKNPAVRGPQNVPIVMPPEGESPKGPYTGGRPFTDEERKQIEEIMEKRRQEYGAVKENEEYS